MNKQIMKYTCFVFAFCLFVGVSHTASAQQNDAVMKSKVRDLAIKVIAEEYDTYASVNNDEAFYSFLRLFTGEEVVVFNDLLGISREKNMPVGDYARLLKSSNLKSKRIFIKNIKIENEPKMVNGLWNTTVTFDKEMLYYDQCGVFWSSKEFYGTDYHLTARIVYDEIDQRCRIERLDGDVNSNKSLPSEYQVFKKSNESDNKLSYHQRQLAFNNNNQAILEGTYDSHGFTHPDYNELRPSIDECNIVTMSYGRLSASRSKSVLLKPYISFDMGKSLTVEGNKVFDDCKSTGLAFGVDIGYPLVSSNQLVLSAFAGLGIMSSSLSDLSYEGDYHYSAGPEADIDGDSYERHYKGLHLEQTVKLTDLLIPLYFEAEYVFTDMFAAYVDLGLRLNFNMSNSVNSDKAHVDKIYGVYSKYKDIVLDAQWGCNEFTDTPKDLKLASSEKLDGIKGMSANLLADIGLRCKIPNSSFAVGLGVGLVKGLGDIYKPDKKSNSYRYVDYTVEKGEQVGGLVNLCESIKRQSLRLSVHLVYNFNR